jgi:hypothetical protein
MLVQAVRRWRDQSFDTQESSSPNCLFKRIDDILSSSPPLSKTERGSSVFEHRWTPACAGMTELFCSVPAGFSPSLVQRRRAGVGAKTNSP